MDRLRRLEALLEDFAAARSLQQTPAPLRVDRLLAISDAFLQLDADERWWIVDTLSTDTGLRLMSSSGLLAGTAIDTCDARLLKAAIVLHVMEDFRTDSRENIRFLVLVDHAARRIDCSLPGLIQELAPFATARTKAYLGDFSRRDLAMNALAGFDIVQDTEDGRTVFTSVPDRFSRSRSRISGD